MEYLYDIVSNNTSVVDYPWYCVRLNLNTITVYDQTSFPCSIVNTDGMVFKTSLGCLNFEDFSNKFFNKKFCLSDTRSGLVFLSNNAVSKLIRCFDIGHTHYIMNLLEFFYSENKYSFEDNNGVVIFHGTDLPLPFLGDKATFERDLLKFRMNYGIAGCKI